MFANPVGVKRQLRFPPDIATELKQAQRETYGWGKTSGIFITGIDSDLFDSQ